MMGRSIETDAQGLLPLGKTSIGRMAWSSDSAACYGKTRVDLN